MFQKLSQIGIIKKFFSNDEEEKEEDHLSVAIKHFRLHYTEPKTALNQDIENIKNCKISSSVRGFIWLFFMGIIPFKAPLNWQKIINEERANYLVLRTKYLTKDVSDFIEKKRINNTKEYDSYKEILKKEDFELLNLIKVDVDRTYQEHEIFTRDNIKIKLITCLYIFSKEYPKYSYRQGMNDICGVFLYVLYRDFELDDKFEIDTPTCVYSVIHSNNNFLEHDLYLMFSRFMKKGVADFFLYNSIEYKKGFLGNKSLEEKKAFKIKDLSICDDSDLKKRAYIIYYKVLKKIDNEFYDILVDNVEPELFLIRWYLCVFTREFKLDQIVHLWDLIIFYEFVESKICKTKKFLWHYNFMDYIALSMIINCKQEALKKGKDANNLMNVMMHFPTDITIEKIVKKALEIYSKYNPEIKV